MIRAQGSVPYPPSASSAPIRQFAGSLRQLAAGLQQSSGQLTAVATATRSGWTGAASTAFGNHVDERSRTVQRTATAIGNAAPVLEAYAAAIDTTSAAYTQAALAEHAARGGLPWTSAALAAAIAAQQAAVAGLVAAGSACASGLGTTNGEVGAAVFAGVDPGAFTSARDTMTEIWGRVGGLVDGADTAEDDARAATAELDIAMWEVERQLDDVNGLLGPIGHLDQLDQFVVATSPRPPQSVPRVVAPAATGGVPLWRRSPIVSSTGEPFTIGPDGRVGPGRTSLILGPDGRPFPLDDAGRPMAGPRIVVPSNGGIVDWTRATGSLEQRLDHIGRQVDGLRVGVDEPVRAPTPSVSGVGRIEAGARSLLRGLGRLGGALGVAVGVDDTYRGIRDGDMYRVADGLVSITLAAAGFVALANPVGLATVLVLGVGWSVATALSGDVPVNRRIAEATSNGLTSAREHLTETFRTSPAPTPAPAVTGPAVVVPPTR